MTKTLRILGIILIVAGMVGIGVGIKYNEQADERNRLASIAVGKQVEMYSKWAMEDRQSASTWMMAGCGSLVTGIVVLLVAQFVGKRTRSAPRTSASPGVHEPGVHDSGVRLRRVGGRMFLAFLGAYLVAVGITLFIHWLRDWKPIDGGLKYAVAGIGAVIFLIGITGAGLWLTGFIRSRGARRESAAQNKEL